MVAFFDCLSAVLFFFADALELVLNDVITVCAAAVFIYLISQIVMNAAAFIKVSKLQKSPGLLQVEAEVTKTEVKRWKKFFGEYDVTLSYSVYGKEFSKKLISRTKLPEKSKIDLLFEPYRPEKAVLKDGTEGRSVLLTAILKAGGLAAAVVLYAVLTYFAFEIPRGFNQLFFFISYLFYWAAFDRVFYAPWEYTSLNTVDAFLAGVFGTYIVLYAGLALILFVKMIYDIVTFIMQSVNSKHINDNISQNFFTVEGEVLGFTGKRFGKADTQYKAYIEYTVEGVKYCKDFALHKRSRLWVGQKITLLCDNGDHSNAALQNDNNVKKPLWLLIFTVAAEILIFSDAVEGLIATVKKMTQFLMF